MSTIAIALAGGGPLGGIYEIGACAALADSIKGLRFEQADIYVGVSSGAVVASALANGISPDKLVRILLSDDSSEFFDPSTLLRPAFGEYLDRLTSLPPLAWECLADYLSAPWNKSLLGSLQGMSKAIPTGLFDSRGVDRFLTQFFSRRGRSNDFRKLKSRLFVIATELDTGRAVAFGSLGLDDVPILAAVQASAALPGLFPPSLINGRHYVDGALIKTLHASVALQEGADLVFCINPLVPFDAGIASERPANLVDSGLPVVLAQTFRAIIHSRMHVGMDRYKHQYPDADALLFEPSQADGEMFFANVFSYRDRRHLCEHAFQHTRRDLWQRRAELGPILAKHGLELNLGALADQQRSLLTPGTGSVAALDASLTQLQHWLTHRYGGKGRRQPKE
ncbi:patatin-like phospholipase family protein [Aeromonas salmonicida]|uniref:patatin-like phospholipase family protein n=1 Tax=Aeromonas salmonicida TaxID=645 RepID=UPI0024785A31|nr:patatin-like phospholipase family protein [Aeromonas salmonicida]ELI6438629.1 patatin-like phospholipase family protein [Aeromonas salmonicida subsp. salmonicida]ELM3708071.1 patatin-like phospholipase family protein [Aeromonas salmonicida subsp. salmonicida]ELT1964373.1 patatin-like phospholipase family protein [Aeromonas salmonicida]MDH7625602.1 patatin-like phospholipase family protein [Aeromonas salmonicida]